MRPIAEIGSWVQPLIINKFGLSNGFDLILEKIQDKESPCEVFELSQYMKILANFS